MSEVHIYYHGVEKTRKMNSQGKTKNKYITIFLILFLGCSGAHKFYEGKIGMGVVYLFTMGLFMIGVIVDFITILTKPNPYAV